MQEQTLSWQAQLEDKEQLLQESKASTAALQQHHAEVTEQLDARLHGQQIAAHEQGELA